MEEKTLKALCELVKRKCKITWNDEDTDKRVQEIVENADESMRHMLAMKDASEDAFLKPGKTRMLFENYCMYDWNNVLNQFEENYRKEILVVRHMNEVNNANRSDEQL